MTTKLNQLETDHQHIQTSIGTEIVETPTDEDLISNEFLFAVFSVKFSMENFYLRIQFLFKFRCFVMRMQTYANNLIFSYNHRFSLYY